MKVIKIISISCIIAFLSILILSYNVLANNDETYVVSYRDSGGIAFYLRPNNMNIGLEKYEVIFPYGGNNTIKIINNTGEHNIITNKTIYVFNQYSDFTLVINNNSYGNIRILIGSVSTSDFLKQERIGLFTMEQYNEAVKNIFVSTLISTFFICLSSFIIFKRIKENEVLEELL